MTGMLHYLHVLSVENWQQAVSKAARGDHDAQQCLEAASKALQEFKRRGLTCICLDCTTQLTMKNLPLAFAIVIPAFITEEYSHAVALGVCSKCYQRDDIQEQIMKTMKEMWPACHIVVPTVQ
jgi:flagellar biosynthesis protein FliP